jgi:hypothetical protein
MNQSVENPNPLAARDVAPDATHTDASDLIGRQVWARYGAWPGIVAHQRTHGLVQRLLHWSTTADGWPARQRRSDSGHSTTDLVFRHVRHPAGDAALPADLPFHSSSQGSHTPGSTDTPVQRPGTVAAVQAQRLPAVPLVTHVDRPLAAARARLADATPAGSSRLSATQDQPSDRVDGSPVQRMGSAMIQRYRSSALHRPISRVGGGLLSRVAASATGALTAAQGSMERVAPPATSPMVFKAASPRTATTPEVQISGVQIAPSTQGSPGVAPASPATMASPAIVVQRHAATPVDPIAPHPHSEETSTIRRSPSVPDSAVSAADASASPSVAQSARSSRVGSSTSIGSAVLQRYMNPMTHRPKAPERIRPTTSLSTPAGEMVHTARIAPGDAQTGPAMPLVVSATRVEGEAAQLASTFRSSSASSSSAPLSLQTASQPMAPPVNPSQPAPGDRSTSPGMVLPSIISRSESTSSQRAEQGDQGAPAPSQAGALARTTPLPRTDAAAPPLDVVVQRRIDEQGRETTSAPGITPAHTSGSTRPATGERAATAGALGAGIYRRLLAGVGARPGPSTRMSLPTVQASSQSGAGGHPLPVVAVRLPGRDPVAGVDEQPATAVATAPQGVPASMPVAQPVILHPAERATSQMQSGQLGFNLQAQYVDRPAARLFRPMVQAAAAQTTTAAPVVVTASYVAPGESASPPMETSQNAQPPFAAGMARPAQGPAAVERVSQRPPSAAGAEQALSQPVVQPVVQRSTNPADVILAGGPFVQAQRSAGTTDAPMPGSTPFMDGLPVVHLDREGSAQPAGSAAPSQTMAPSRALPMRQTAQPSTPPAATASSVVLQRAESYDSQSSASYPSASSGMAAEFSGASFSASDMDDAQLERMADKVYRIIEQRLIVERESMGL